MSATSLAVTIFDDVHANSCQEYRWQIDDLADRLREPKTYPSKAACKLLKLAIFGEQRTEKGCLRHDPNVLEIFGVEGDYDGGEVSLADAQMLLSESNITGILYTSPSHTPAKPRWRVLAPLSRPYPPSERARFVAQLNGCLKGILAPESFNLSQSYYCGRVEGAPYAVAQVRGKCIDELAGLAEIYPAKQGKTKAERLDNVRNKDPVIAKLKERNLLLRTRTDGGADLICPFEAEHTSPRAPGDCTYFPPHTGGFSQAHFKCLHSHCATRSDDDFFEAIGIEPKAYRGNGSAQAIHSDESINIIPAETERPCFHVFDKELEHGGKTFRQGVWYFSIKHGKDGDTPTLGEQWICSPVHVDAVTFDAADNNFGRLLRFKNTLGHWREWAMAMELLRGAGDDLRGELLAMGVHIDPGAHRLLGQYLQAKTPERRVNCALQVGWCGDSFVLPDTVIGRQSSAVVFQSGERGRDEYTIGGTLAGWQSDVAARAVGNPLLILALSASFAGPLLAACNAESGGLHFVGDSSTGKTTIIEAACATWGGPNYRRSWRATANGMEGAASLFNDCLLALDEISECDPREIGAIVYALGNGRGKQRASRTGNARGVTRWRCVVISSGERTLGTAMSEGGYRAKAGQGMRLLDLPAARTFGAWDDLHGLPTGAAFADVLKRAAVTHYGHAGRAFLEKLTRDTQNFAAFLERVKALPEFCAEASEGQDKRAAGRFALMAMAGELATEYGITGWPEGAALDAAAQGFMAWRAMRGRGNDERRQILEAVSGFIERHGDGRFSDADTHSDVQTMVRDRAGWWRDSSEGRTYLFTKDGMREAVKGFDLKRALDSLQESGALPVASGERAKPERIKARGAGQIRLYAILQNKLEAAHEP